jgi:hypothetical protein
LPGISVAVECRERGLVQSGSADGGRPLPAKVLDVVELLASAVTAIARLIA